MPEATETRQALLSQSVQLTREQLAWLDARAQRTQSLSRSAEVRALIQGEMDRDQETAAAAA